MKVTFGNPSFTVVSNKTFCTLPYEFTFNYDEGKIGIRAACQQLLYIIAKEKGIMLKGKMTASTTCSDTDVYDEVLGHRIAEAKTKMKVYRNAYNVFHALHKHVSNLTLGIMDALDRHDDLHYWEVKHYDELLGIDDEDN